ncbi:MAG: TetR/AcrR family transcriptional regulator [Halioglobus sp.]
MRTRGETARQRILDASTSAFAQFGYEGTSLDRIARTLGVTRQALLFHYKDKRGLYDASLERLFEQREEGMVSRTREEFKSLGDYVDYLVQYAVEFYLGHPEYIALVLRLLMAEGPHAAQAPSSGVGMVARFEEVLREGVKEGVMQDIPVSHLVAVIGGTLSYYKLLPQGARTGVDLMAYDPRAPEEVARISRNLQRAVRGMLGLSQSA